MRMDWINNAGKLAGSISAVIALLALVLIKPIKKAAARHMEAEEAQQRFQAEVLAKLDAITDDIADLQYERLSRRTIFTPRRAGARQAKKSSYAPCTNPTMAKGAITSAPTTRRIS